MKNYEIFLIRQGAALSAKYYPNVGKVYIAPGQSELANSIYRHHTPYIINNLREYDFNESRAASDSPIFTGRCVKGLEEIFADMCRTGVYKSAVIASMGVIVTLLAGCGLPKAAPSEFEIEPGEAWLISMSTYLWQKGQVFEIIGRLTQ